MPQSLEFDDKFYIVASDVNQGKQYAYVIELEDSQNLTEALKTHPNMQTSTIFTDRVRAYDVAENFNEIFRINGTFGYQEPDTSIWHVYDNDKGEMIHGEAAWTKVTNDILKTAHGEPETIDPTKLDLSDSDIIQKGYWGPNYSVEWSITNDGTLYLNGRHITNEGHTPPWAAYDIKRCVINCDTIDECVFIGGRIPAKDLEIHCKDIGSGAFSYSNSLEKLKVEANNISDSAFSGCQNLKSADIKCEEQMKPFAFFNCQALQIVNITGDIDTVQDGTFSNCANLKTVTIEGNTDISNHALPDGTRVTRTNDDIDKGNERKVESVREAPTEREHERKAKTNTKDSELSR